MLEHLLLNSLWCAAPGCCICNSVYTNDIRKVRILIRKRGKSLFGGSQKKNLFRFILIIRFDNVKACCTIIFIISSTCSLIIFVSCTPLKNSFFLIILHVLC